MSHQDQGRNGSADTHADDLHKALRWLLPKHCFQDMRFRQDCTWTPHVLVLTAVLWAWSDYRQLTKRFQHARKIIKHLFGKQHKPATSYQAFTKLLRKWTQPLLERLAVVFRHKMTQALADVWQVGKWVVFAVDGSRINVPRTRGNEERYSPKSKLSRAAQRRRRVRRRKSRAAEKRKQQAREEKANVPLIWLTVLWHVRSGLPWAWQTGPSDSSERAHLQAMLATLPKDSLLVADAGFVGYDLWRQVRDQGLHLLVRVGGNVKLLKKLGYAREHRGTVSLWPERAAARHEPPLVLRLIVVNDGSRSMHLVTDLNLSELSDRTAGEVYARRWGIEVFYRHCKQTFERAKLRSHNPDNALVELQWSLVGMWALGLHSHARLTKRGVPPPKISFAGVLHAYRESMRYYTACPERNERLTYHLDRALIDDYQRKNKTSRNYPRQKQETAPAPPILQRATAEQRRKAKQVKEEQRKRLTA